VTRWTRGVALLLVVACGSADEGPRRGRRARQAEVPITAVGVDAPRAVVLVVMDTVRADHTSLCGYERPTTPVLRSLAGRRSAVHACHAYSAAPWTQPSHASMFTGLAVSEHGSIWVRDSEIAINPVTRVRPLEARFTTLAEAFRERGYQTAALSANVIVTESSGLLQGFDHRVTSPTMLGLRGRKLEPALRGVLGGLDPSKPLFLFVNLYDAHDPYPPVPPGAGWGEGQTERLDLHPDEDDADNPQVRFLTGAASEAESAPFLARVRDGYDAGVLAADTSLGVVVRLLESSGWGAADLRLAVTSDHGEALGEHRLLRHGGYLVEPMVSVPLVLLDTTRAPPALPDPVSNVVVHDWLLHGTLADLPVVAASERNERRLLEGRVEAAAWSGAGSARAKAVCRPGPPAERLRYDLAADPGELAPVPLGGTDPLAATLSPACDGLERVLALPVPRRADAQIEALKAAGYVE
jgi:hypothetical protein